MAEQPTVKIRRQTPQRTAVERHFKNTRTTQRRFKRRQSQRAGHWVTIDAENLREIKIAMARMEKKAATKMRQVSRTAVKSELIPAIKKELAGSVKPSTSSGRLLRHITAQSTATEPKIKIGTPTIYWHWWKHAGTKYYTGYPFVQRGIYGAWPQFISHYVREMNRIIAEWNAVYGSSRRGSAVGSIRELDAKKLGKRGKR